MKGLLTIFGCIVLFQLTKAQTLFTYGGKKVSKAEFIKAYKKNTDVSANGPEQIKNYLELYTRFKLKVQDAYDLRIDTLIRDQEDILAFRKQIEDQFMNDEVMLKKLVDEARVRGQKEINLSHIFIPFRPEFVSNPLVEIPITKSDTQLAWSKITEAYNKLANREDFSKTAMQFTADPSVAFNGGNLGYITVFTLPYSLENVAYSLSTGETSKPFMSDAGYHIFRKNGERPASGRMVVQQILIAYDTSGGSTSKQYAARLTDSLYQLIKGGAPFAELAKTYSLDMFSAPAGGLLPPVATGVYDIKFEDNVFALQRDGEVAAPFETSTGFHIIKRIQKIPVDTANFAGTPWNLAIEQDKRGQLPKAAFEKTTCGIIGAKKKIADPSELFRYTDSFAVDSKKGFFPTLDNQTILFEMPGSVKRVNDWLNYATKNGGQKTRAQYMALWERYQTENCTGYYRKNLEKYNPVFSEQIREFMEGNMLFEVMERKVWGKAASDSAGLLRYYKANKAKYNWDKSAEAILFNTADSATAAGALSTVMKDPTSWRILSETSGGRINADSSRMAWDQILPGQELTHHTHTPILVNPEDGSASFIFVVAIHPLTEPKTYYEALGSVMNDYQTELEEKWITTLKKKYPVVVNKEVLESALKELQ
jgi:peptidyl-prolyl cis-trans isomerase SurA